MTEQLDPNRIAADVIHRVFRDTARSISSSVRESLNRIFDIFRKDINAYLASTISKCCLIKTPIINRDRPTYFFDIYVHTKLTNRGKSWLDDEFIQKLPDLKSVVVAGNAGSGKSMLMRYLFMALCERGFGRIPLFIELRNLNLIAKKDLLTFIYYSVVGPGAVISEEQFETSLRNGAYSLILDGFDEVDFDQRKSIENQILQLREKYPDLLLIISSRPDPDGRFESWAKFHVMYVDPMEEKQIVELIRRVDYDTKIKSRFLKTLREGLFQTHRSFLSNPLLCLMMLVTFEQTGNIPDKKHIFYEHAFDALFFLHDSAKEGVYRRKTYANLPIDEFRNCLSAFCIISYIKERFSFSSAELRENVNQALKLEQKEIDCRDFISDLIESTCLLQVEGTEYAFTHRSFQEYFAALFISRSPATDLKQLLDQVSRRRADDVIPMAFAMNKHLLEREWIVPRLKDFVALASELSPTDDYLGYMSTLFGTVGLNIVRGKYRAVTLLEVNSSGFIWMTIEDLYPKAFSEANRWSRRQEKKCVPIIQNAIEEMYSRRDARLFSERADSKRLKLNKVSCEIALIKHDMAWLKRIWISEFESRYVEAMKKLLISIEGEARNQSAMLTNLLLQPAGQLARPGDLLEG